MIFTQEERPRRNLIFSRYNVGFLVSCVAVNCATSVVNQFSSTYDGCHFVNTGLMIFNCFALLSQGAFIAIDPPCGR